MAWIDQQRIRRDRSGRGDDRRLRTRSRITDSTASIPDYGGGTFHLQPGDIIADGGYFEFEPDKLYDPLEAPVGSCFQFIAESQDQEGHRGPVP